eukprot:5718022-Pleurochrysis_carterae.AAC.2
MGPARAARAPSLASRSQTASTQAPPRRRSAVTPTPEQTSAKTRTIETVHGHCRPVKRPVLLCAQAHAVCSCREPVERLAYAEAAAAGADRIRIAEFAPPAEKSSEEENGGGNVEEEKGRVGKRARENREEAKRKEMGEKERAAAHWKWRE